jgi:hypothetical protein
MATRDSKNGKVQKKSEQPFTRDDFFRDLKKAAKKRDQPSQRGSKKR